MNYLHSTYNGFMLGQFLRAGGLKSIDEAVVHRRCSEFIREINVDFAIPDSYGGFRRLGEQTSKIAEILMDQEWALGAAFMIGYWSTNYFIECSLSTPDGSGLEILADITNSPGIDLTIKELADNIEPSGSINAVMSASLALATRMIEDVQLDTEAAFVSFPFTPVGFSDRYTRLYAPALEASGYKPIRAWGGFFSENYTDILVELISKCHFMLADITNSNANVVHEIGLAQGLGKVVYLCVEGDGASSPSNFIGLPMAKYSTSDEGWESDAKSAIKFIITLTNAVLEDRKDRIPPNKANSADAKSRAAD